jgi:hypothetical protein
VLSAPAGCLIACGCGKGTEHTHVAHCTHVCIMAQLPARMQDKTAPPLDELDVLLEETHQQLLGLADQVWH